MFIVCGWFISIVLVYSTVIVNVIILISVSHLYYLVIVICFH